MPRLVLQKILVALLLAGSLGGCAYRPLYGKQSGGADVAAVLQSIAVVEQTTRVGQLVRNELISSFGGQNASSSLTLKLSVRERDVSVSSLGGTTVSRLRSQVTADFVLIDVATGKEVTKGSSTSAVSYDTNLEPIADLQSTETARSRAAREVAQDIKLRLSAFLAANQ